MGSFRLAPVAGWCAATATSIVLGSVAILPVLRTSEPADTALAQLPAANATSFPAPLPSVTGPGDAPSRPTTAPTSRKPRTTAPTPTSGSATTSAPGRATTPPTTTEDGWTVTTAADGLRTFVRSFKVEGGQAVIRMTSDGVVELVTATPADGYAVQKVQDSPDNMAVYFNETGHSFIIHATWWDDRPFSQVSEIGQ
ncbi:DNA mismatch repair protein MutL [Paractinoplanes rishiriensis]|nr:DNA mismatch repair protein MutL [Actinoplanes rishiriensis]